jgi:hypothetical protein
MTLSAVILRCDNCGTSQSALGDCEACHEGQVRYYCKNHNPGRWLDAPRCSKCGAEYGVTVNPPPTRPVTGVIRSRPEKGASAGGTPAPTIRSSRRPGGPWGPRPTRSPEEIYAGETRAKALERLRRVLEGRDHRRASSEPTDFTYDARMPMAAIGCFRVVLLVMLFLLISLLGLSNFGSLILGY